VIGLRRAAFILAAAALAMPALLAGPAGAADPVCDQDGIGAPDARAREDGESFVGAGEFGVTTVGSTVPPGGKAQFVAKWKNVSGKARRIRVDLSSFFTGQDVRARVLVNGENVTDSLIGSGEIVFGPIEPGRSTRAVEVVVRNKSTGLNGAHVELFGTYGRRENPTCDAIEVVANAS
jgi:hypothetical protein